MNKSSTIQRRSSWHLLAAVSIAIHVTIYLLPIPIVALHSGDSGIRQYLVLLMPLAWSVFIFLRYRHPTERAVAWCSLAMTALWILAVGSIKT
jgi:hypothetical protein